MTVTFEKSYVQADNHAPIVCPECGFLKLICVEGFSHRTKNINVKCKCGFLFKRFLEFRKSYRKKTDLQGLYDLGQSVEQTTRVQLVDLSLGGACLVVPHMESFSIGEHGQLHFTLDNQKNSEITRRLVVRSFSPQKVHCAFINDKAYDKELGFYLRP